MHIKQISLIIAAFLFAIATGVGLIALGPVTESASAYRCEGTPDDYYQYDKSASDTLQKLPSNGTGEAFKYQWDDALGSCTVTIPDSKSGKKSQNADGSPRACAANEVLGKDGSTWVCAPLKTFQTNDKPVNDDGSQIDASQIYCGGQDDVYDAESFSCKETGCGLGTCSYNKVGMNADPTKDCIGGGGIYKKGGSPTCTFSEDSCKGKNLKLKEVLRESNRSAD